jgi:hypothetical protein
MKPIADDSKAALFELTRRAKLHNGTIDATNFFTGFLAYYFTHEYDKTEKNKEHPEALTSDQCLEKVKYLLSKPLSIGIVYNIIHYLFEAYRKKKEKEIPNIEDKPMLPAIVRKINFIKGKIYRNV